jgi:DNA helicase-2/ATP-dependent DNA helicase PcrA
MDHTRPGASVTAGFISARIHTTTSVQQGFSTASATMPVQQGFVSVSDRYDELMAEAKLDKRLGSQEQKQQQKKSETALTAPKGRKRQIEGQGGIASFFQQGRTLKKQKEEAEPQRALREISNMPEHRTSASAVCVSASSTTSSVGFMTARQRQTSSLTTHKPRSTPMLSRPSTSTLRSIATSRDDGENAEDPHHRHQGKYVFLSSSPAKPEERDEPHPPPVHDDDDDDDDDDDATTRTSAEQHVASEFQPASSFHTTSMQSLQAPQRRTLGVRRSMNGWAARMGR